MTGVFFKSELKGKYSLSLYQPALLHPPLSAIWIQNIAGDLEESVSEEREAQLSRDEMEEAGRCFQCMCVCVCLRETEIRERRERERESES